MIHCLVHQQQQQSFSPKIYKIGYESSTDYSGLTIKMTPPLKWRLPVVNRNLQEIPLRRCHYDVDVTKSFATKQGTRRENCINKIINMHA
jgi:hypothetical protein